MDPEQLQQWLAQHKTAALGAAAVGVVGLAVWQRKKTTGGGPTSTTTGGAVPGTIPAAAIAAQPVGGTYDSSSYDLYNALQPELAQILAQQSQQTGGGSGITAPPVPVASTLFAPTGTGKWIVMPNGVTGEIESDGSIFGATADQFHNAGGIDSQRTPIGQNVTYYDTGHNVIKSAQGAGS